MADSEGVDIQPFLSMFEHDDKFVTANWTHFHERKRTQILNKLMVQASRKDGASKNQRHHQPGKGQRAKQVSFRGGNIRNGRGRGKGSRVGRDYDPLYDGSFDADVTDQFSDSPQWIDDTVSADHVESQVGSNYTAEQWSHWFYDGKVGSEAVNEYTVDQWEQWYLDGTAQVGAFQFDERAAEQPSEAIQHVGASAEEPMYTWQEWADYQVQPSWDKVGADRIGSSNY
jgi:hypothetical protein